MYNLWGMKHMWNQKHLLQLKAAAQTGHWKDDVQ